MLNFQNYDLIVDARSPREYADDHLPGALNLPVVEDAEYAQVGTGYKSDPHAALLFGVTESLRNIARNLELHFSALPKRTRVLVYCFRGGKRSRLWFDALDTIGFRVERLAGGWRAYRRWVIEQLAALPATFHYHVLCGPTGCGKTRLLQALHAAGAQVLDLEALALHRGSLIGGIPDTPQPPQKLFESHLLARLQQFDPARPVWVEAESKKIGERQLPGELFAAMHAGTCFNVEAPMLARVKLWREDYAHFERDLPALLAQLQHLRPLVGGEVLQRWQQMADQAQVEQLFEALMLEHYDPAYTRSMRRNYPQLGDAANLSLPDLEPATLQAIAAQLIAREQPVVRSRDLGAVATVAASQV